MGPLLGHESVLDNSVDGSNAVVATAIAQPTTTAIVIPLEPLIGFAVLIRWSILTPSASPTAAPAADRLTVERCGQTPQPVWSCRGIFPHGTAIAAAQSSDWRNVERISAHVRRGIAIASHNSDIEVPTSTTMRNGEGSII